MLRWRRSQRDQGKTEQVRETVIGEKIVQIFGMTCEHCVNRVMRALNKIDGVSANVSLKGKRAVVSYDREIDVNVLKKAVEDAGYTVESIS